MTPEYKSIPELRNLSDAELADYIEQSNYDFDGTSQSIRVALARILRRNWTRGDDALALETAKNIEAEFERPRLGGAVQRRARIQCHVLDAIHLAARPVAAKPYVDPMESMLGRPYGQERNDVTCENALCCWPSCNCGRE